MTEVIVINPCGRTGEIVCERLAAHGVSTRLMTGPSARKMEPAFIRALHKAVEEDSPKMIIPIFFTEVLASHKDEFPGITIPLDSPEKILRLDDKESACALAESLGIRQPRIYRDIEEIETYPVVFKRPDGLGGDSVYFPKTRAALEHLQKTASRNLVMDYIEGDDVSVDALRWGDFFFGAAYKVLEPKRKGVSTMRVSIDAPELVDCTRRMLEAVDYRGVCGADFRISEEDGKAYFLECNPRFSGGLASAVASGFDIPWLYYLAASGKKIPDAKDISFTPGIITH